MSDHKYRSNKFGVPFIKDAGKVRCNLHKLQYLSADERAEVMKFVASDE